ncbi:hypothetical protein E2P81_ATG10033 [Venturia nashicola]|uniref:Uncharacterized protein n=1 Tax=Venturia nashicola TaxID=86259 RepID=A0A4Z1NGA0_9PEZI|nr:hypothetical protein E6O75_ATG10253 [Venturia nashicola]TLD14738.1 hypothetical protein E2P81_ATG10033 [Venturia nashicola]
MPSNARTISDHAFDADRGGLPGLTSKPWTRPRHTKPISQTSLVWSSSRKFLGRHSHTMCGVLQYTYEDRGCKCLRAKKTTSPMQHNRDAGDSNSRG